MWYYLKKFFKYIKPYWWMIVLGTVSGVLKFNLNLILPLAIKHLIDVIIGGKEGLFLGFRIQSIHLLFAIVLAACAIQTWATYFRSCLIQIAGNKIMFDIRVDLYEHIQKLSLPFFESRRTGAIVSRLLSDINEAVALVNRGFVTVVMDAFLLVIVIWIIIHENWKLSLAALSILPLYGLLFKLISRNLKKVSKSVQEEMAELHGEIFEKLSAVKVVQSFAREKLEAGYFRERNLSYLDRLMLRIKLAATLSAVADFLMVLGSIVVLWYGGALVKNGELTIGAMIAFYAYIGQLYLPIRRFADVNEVLQTSMASIERIVEYFDIVPEVKDGPDAAPLKEVSGHIVFENVSFAYDHSRDERVLNDVSFEIKPGENVALVGESGSGKTTIANLVPRFYDPISGIITIDGVSIQKIKLKALRKLIGIVLQESILFSGTIKENILYGKIKATDAEVEEAARMANAHDFIMEMPDGYDTVIGERGVKLSGGQRQRVSIARAFLKDPRILVLDEATSSLDSKAENIIQEALNKLMKGRTTLVIAHRLSTIAGADRIIVLEEGRIVEAGRHEELLARNGAYSRLYREQFNSFSI